MGYRIRVVLVVISTTVFGCALFKSTARTVIDVALATCIAEHPEVVTESELQKVCPYIESLGPIVRDLLSARKRGLARVGADAGAQDASKE